MGKFYAISAAKLWEELTREQQLALSDSWDKEASEYRQKLAEDYHRRQVILQLLRDRPVQPIKTNPASSEPRFPILPEKPGFYLWYVLDISYLDVGMVHVVKDSPEHISILNKREKSKICGFFLYEASNGDILTMYHQAYDHLPHCTDDGVPCVDGYISMDLDQFV